MSTVASMPKHSAYVVSGPASCSSTALLRAEARVWPSTPTERAAVRALDVTPYEIAAQASVGVAGGTRNEVRSSRATVWSAARKGAARRAAYSPISPAAGGARPQATRAEADRLFFFFKQKTAYEIHR